MEGDTADHSTIAASKEEDVISLSSSALFEDSRPTSRISQLKLPEIPSKIKLNEQFEGF